MIQKLLFFLFFTISVCGKAQNSELNLIPKPQFLQMKTGTFNIDKSTTIYFEPEFEIAGNFLNDFLQNGAGFQLKNASKSDAKIVIEKDGSQPSEGYFLDISNSKITIKAADSGGAFYAIQTLRQIFPAALESPLTPKEGIRSEALLLPQMTISDFPKFQYRGMHLDCARHFFDVEFVKKYIANLALLKMN